MKKILTFITALLLGFAAHAQTQDEPPTTLPSPAEAAPAPAAAESAAPKQLIEVVGFIKGFEVCGDKGGEKSETYARRASNAAAQISERFGLMGALTRVVIAGVAGSIVGSAVEAPIEERKICTKIGFKDGSPDVKLEEPALHVKGRKIKDSVKVRFEDGKAVEFFFI